MIATDILGAIYAPHKAFKKIIENPKYLGALIILVIFVLAQLGSSYIVGQHTFIEQTMPRGDQKDAWTENASLWQANSGVSILNNTADYVNASAYYGQTSIQFTATNATNLRMEINNLDGSINCRPDGFRSVSFRVKIISPSAASSSVSLYMNSLDSSSFYQDITDVFSNGTINTWYNLTIPLDTADWTSNGAGATWANITGLHLEFSWQSLSDVNLLLDGLFFRGIYKTPLETDAGAYLTQAAFNAVTQFVFMWLILTGIMYLIIKGLKGNVTWKPLTIAIGIALVAMIFQSIILIIIYSSLLPTVNYPLELLAGVSGEFQIAYNALLSQIALVNQISLALLFVIYGWIAILGTFVVREITEFSWPKSIAISIGSVLITVIIIGFLIGI